MMKPRLLIISNNPVSETQHNGKTVQSFVRNWEQDRIAQLYFRNEKPCTDTCRNFFRFTDGDALSSLIPGRKAKEQVAQMDANLPAMNKSSKIERLKQGDMAKLLREGIWKLSAWKSTKLLAWLDEFRPEVILFVGGDSIFAYRITEFIKERYQAKVLLYITDDYVTKRFSLSPFYQLRFTWLLHHFNKMLAALSDFATIGSKMSEEYLERFRVRSFSLMNAVEPMKKSEYHANRPLRLIYFGGLHFNRHKSLGLIAQALQEINQGEVKAMLEIYTGSNITEEIASALNIEKASMIMGHLKKEEVEQVMGQADVLIHVEAFDQKSIHSTRLSVSTKIPEYMMNQRCILGVGPKEVGSIEYLSNFAAVITEPKIEVVKKELLTLINDPIQRTRSIEKAYALALEHHNINTVNEVFTEAVMKIAEKEDILFVGGMFPKDETEEIRRNSQGQMQTAADYLQWNLIDGLEEAQGHPIDLISSRFVGYFPGLYKKAYLPKRDFSHRPGARDYACRLINIKGIEIYHRMYSLYRPIRKWLKEKGGKGKVVLYSANPQFLYAAKKIKKSFPKAHLSLIVPDLPEYMKVTQKRSFARFVYDTFMEGPLNRMIYGNMQYIDSFVLLTEEMKEALKVGNRPYCIVEGVVGQHRRSSSNETRMAVNASEKTPEKKILLYTGTLAKKYGIMELVDEFMKVTDPMAELHICGAGDAQGEILERAKQDHRICFHGILSHGEILEMQNQATFLVNPRRNNEEYTKYSFPSKTMEYMQSGRPVLMYRLDGIPKEYDDYLIYIPEEEELNRVLSLQLQREDEELRALGERAKAFVEGEKNPKRQAQKIMELLTTTR